MNAILGMYKSDELTNDVLPPRLEFIPILANITAGDNVALRHYYKGECTKDVSADSEDNACQEMTVKKKKLMAGFPAKFIFLVHDTRY